MCLGKRNWKLLASSFIPVIEHNHLSIIGLHSGTMTQLCQVATKNEIIVTLLYFLLSGTVTLRGFYFEWALNTCKGSNTKHDDG
jgi:hypothetical protein